mmetsp:Transcript_2023/g.4807  ORF Transcript_2023/g.4807 Transcript_2023/m.4807 type:complete len:97 (+) Transcript_2023:40-330(+)
MIISSYIVTVVVFKRKSGEPEGEWRGPSLALLFCLGESYNCFIGAAKLSHSLDQPSTDTYLARRVRCYQIMGTTSKRRNTGAGRCSPDGNTNSIRQ